MRDVKYIYHIVRYTLDAVSDKFKTPCKVVCKPSKVYCKS